MSTHPSISPGLHDAARRRARELRDETMHACFTSAGAALRRASRRLAAALARHGRLRSPALGS